MFRMNPTLLADDAVLGGVMDGAASARDRATRYLTGRARRVSVESGHADDGRGAGLGRVRDAAAVGRVAGRHRGRGASRRGAPAPATCRRCRRLPRLQPPEPV